MLATLLHASAAFAPVKTAIAARGGATRNAAGTSMLGSLFGGLMQQPQMISPENALPGRPQKMQVAPRHYVLGTPMEEPEGGWPEGYKVAVLANGCFWGSEKGMWTLPGDGIYTTSVGYAAGFTPNPTYEECCSGRSGHTEAMQIVYDPEKIAFADILRWFWEAHDPTAGMAQGNDVGTQYRSGAYWFDDEQKELILASKAAYEKALGREITTECAAASDYDQYGGCYYYAENYHQQYLAKPGARPYCSAQPQRVSLPPFEEWAPKSMLLDAKQQPKLPEAFWARHGLSGNSKACGVVGRPDEPVKWGAW